ncbi:unnamed protein product [Gadus morhua 'NCC']
MLSGLGRLQLAGVSLLWARLQKVGYLCTCTWVMTMRHLDGPPRRHPAQRIPPALQRQVPHPYLHWGDGRATGGLGAMGQATGAFSLKDSSCPEEGGEYKMEELRESRSHRGAGERRKPQAARQTSPWPPSWLQRRQVESWTDPEDASGRPGFQESRA